MIDKLISIFKRDKKEAIADLKKRQQQVIEHDAQADVRTTQTSMLNYMAVQTLDPVRLNNAFTMADQGEITEQMSIYDLIEERDTHMAGELAKRRRSVTGLNWQLRPADDASQAEIARCQELQDMVASIPGIEDGLYDMTDGIFKGFTAQEIAGWEGKDTWTPTGLIWVPQRLFRIDQKTGKLLYLRQGIPEQLWSDQWIIHEHRTKSGYIEQAALGRILAWSYSFKAYNVLDMQRYLERYGMPLVVGKYFDGASKEHRDALMRAVRNIGHDGAGIISTQMAIEFVQATQGKAQDFHDSIEYWERKQSIAILGSTLTSQADRGSNTNALGLIHDKVRREIMLHDVRQIEPTLDGLVKKIALVNGMFPANRIPKFKFDTAEQADREMMANVLKTGTEIGMKISVQTAHQLMQIPMASDNEVILSTASSQPENPDTKTALTQLAFLSRQQTDEPDQLNAKLAKLAVRHEEAMLDQIHSILAESNDWDDAIEKIGVLQFNYDKYTELLGAGMMASNLAGRADINKDRN